MPNVFVVVGNVGTGKSSIIRALTGVWSSKSVRVAKVEGQSIEVYVQVRSLQEVKVTPDDFIRNHANDDNILVALRSNGGAFPDAAEYIRLFAASGWTVTRVMDLPANNRSLPPANERANTVRIQLGWL